jgi:hypothetical protein
MHVSRRYLQLATAVFLSGSSFGCQAIAAETAPIPDLSGMWGRNSFDFEPLPSGPVPVTNVRRSPNGSIDQRVSVGDYNNPILKPQAAESVRRRGEVSLSGTTFADPSNQCTPYPPPFSMSITLQLQILQKKDEVVIVFWQDQGVRYVRLNQSHPAHVTPSWYGDSIGHYEGDTLVVDTIGFKVGPLSIIDRYGTPYSNSMHLTERFRIITSSVAKQATAQHEKEYGRVGGPRGAVTVDAASDKGLQVLFTVDDPEVFTTPWSAAVTYLPTTTAWSEYICAENVHDYFSGTTVAVPFAEQPDF